ncbi:TPA: hypothetical protein N0F65_000497 [Lagenidium giganteum]|uniref:PX domain-containing protein n=1 Tax=Lagenidium giganteum TaxID=4803 RepID=A0AAV2YY58_9STRA|nr:TPA: hypothetical protein N0F65_000497 [Lagenidium giganteum]
MYSSYWKPQSGNGRESNVLTDHDALHRDEATHKAIQSNETQLRPLDLETIMSSKAAVKFWYLHRPKTMEYVHKNAVRIQSVGRAFAVRSLIRKYGLEYVVELQKADALKKEAARLGEMTEAERTAHYKEAADFEFRVAETRRLRRERQEMEQADEDALRMRLAIEAEEKRKAEEAAAFAAAEAARIAREEEEARIEAEREAKLAEERAALAAQMAEEEAARFLAEQAAEEEAARIAAEEAAAEEERLRLEAEEEAKREEEMLAAAALAEQRAAEEAEAARLAKIRAEQNEKYEQSLSKDVPVMVRGEGPGRVVNYDKETESYNVRMEGAAGGMVINVDQSGVHLDDDRILSPRTKVDTPFGVGEIVGLDPHVGCYAVKTEVAAPEGEQFLAFIQIKDVEVHVEEEEERAIVEDSAMPIPDEIRLVSARIVDHRVVNKSGKKFIQYKLEIKTSNYGTVYCWKRYSTFRSLCDRLQKENGIKKKDIPELPKRHILGNFSSKTIGERAEKLNLFLNAAVKAEHLQWGIRVDDQIAVYKRRVKKGGFFSRRR